MGFFALAVSIYLSFSEGPTLDPRIPLLEKRGWLWSDPPSCGGLVPGQYYALESETENIEFLYLPPRALAAKGSWPEAPFFCQPISQPSHVQEVL